MEVAFGVDSTLGADVIPITFAQIAEAIANSTGINTSVGAAALSFAKMRITSVVFDPISRQDGAGAVPYEVGFSVSGNRYQSGDIDKPLRVKLSSEFNGDGQWYRAVVIQKSSANVYTINYVDPVGGNSPIDLSSAVFARFHITGALGGTDLVGWHAHFRIAWTDASGNQQ